MKRILLLILTNIGVVLTLSIMASLLGVNQYLTSNGLNFTALIAFCSLYGFGGAFISLLISKKVAKYTMSLKILDPSKEQLSPEESRIYSKVQELSNRAGIQMPEVGIYYGEPNAFATGAFKNSALVGVSTGLINYMSKEEVDAVLAHEIAHIENGDMITTTLIQGVVNSFTMVLARVLGYVVANALKKDEESSSMVYSLLVIAFDVLFSILGSLVVLYHSRTREYAADKGAANLMGSTQPMIAALKRLGDLSPEVTLPKTMKTMGIYGGDVKSLFRTHPSIGERIESLENMNRSI